jgi:NAD(P)-dependent dehydrogenase (short-subunit alcohol dehydrogenase family)
VSEDATLDAALLPAGLVDVNAQQLDLRRHNSWTMVAEEVETPELAEVMAINAMAPFILCARLQGIMSSGHGNASRVSAGTSGAYSSSHSGGHSAGSIAESILAGLGSSGSDPGGGGGGGNGGGEGSRRSTQERGKAVGGVAPRPRRDKDGGHDLHGAKATHGVPAAQCSFIVNVSSMEGKFYRAKLPTHPHTNMAKAALNMLTRTSAGEYAESFIYMTAVDTGWSALIAPLRRQ